VRDQLRTLDFEDDETVAIALGAGGAFAFVLGVVAGSRLLRLVGIGAAVAGGSIYAREMLAARGERIDAAESEIRSELADLDPVARAQVLKDVAQSEL
jgi:prefoldin subunit 5